MFTSLQKRFISYFGLLDVIEKTRNELNVKLALGKLLLMTEKLSGL